MKKLLFILLIATLFSCQKEENLNHNVTIEIVSDHYNDIHIWQDGNVKTYSALGNVTIDAGENIGSLVRVIVSSNNYYGSRVTVKSEYKTYYDDIKKDHDFKFTIE